MRSWAWRESNSGRQIRSFISSVCPRCKCGRPVQRCSSSVELAQQSYCRTHWFGLAVLRGKRSPQGMGMMYPMIRCCIYWYRLRPTAVQVLIITVSPGGSLSNTLSNRRVYVGVSPKNTLTPWKERTSGICKQDPCTTNIYTLKNKYAANVLESKSVVAFFSSLFWANNLLLIPFT